MEKHESKRQRYEILRAQLENEYSSFAPLYQEINDFILPFEGRFQTSDINRGHKRNLEIINSSGTFAANTLHAGMMSGVTSPARPWFRLAAPDPDLNEFGPVKEWLDVVANRMYGVFLKSNLYQSLPYRTLGGFGTAPMSVEEDMDNVIHCSTFPIGSFRIAKDSRGIVNVFYREYSISVRNLVRKFGRFGPDGKPDWSNFSETVKSLYERGNYETYVVIAHVVQPNEQYDQRSPFAKHKKFSSCYYERGISSYTGNRNYMNGSKDDDKYLRESGFDLFPILCPRWHVGGEDVYATDCPGITALGDIKQLQHAENKFGKALDKMIDPPMVFPTSMANQATSILPGGVMFADVREGNQGIRAAHEVNLPINHLDAKIEKIEYRISRAFYEDLFLMLANTDRRVITAREIEERHEEKLLALGPVLERLNQDLLNPLIDITFDAMLKAAMIPKPPEELTNQPLKVEYISIMAQAQKMLGVSTSERFLNSILTILPVKPDVADKVDFDQWIDNYGENLSISPKIIRSDDAVDEIRAQQQQATQAQALLENAPAMASAAKQLSETDTQKPSALKEMMEGQTYEE